MIRDTSIEAYKDLIDRDVLGKMQADVLACLIIANNNEGAVTAVELFKNYIGEGSNVVFKNIRARLSELRDMGAVEERPKRRDAYSGKVALTWHFTGNKPIKVNRVTKQERKVIIKDFMATMLNEAKAENRFKAASDIKTLWRMVKEL